MLFLGTLEAKQGCHSKKNDSLCHVLQIHVSCICLTRVWRMKRRFPCFLRLFSCSAVRGVSWFFLGGGFGWLSLWGQEGGIWLCSFRSGLIKARFPQSASGLQLWLWKCWTTGKTHRGQSQQELPLKIPLTRALRGSGFGGGGLGTVCSLSPAACLLPAARRRRPLQVVWEEPWVASWASQT